MKCDGQSGELLLLETQRCYNLILFKLLFLQLLANKMYHSGGLDYGRSVSPVRNRSEAYYSPSAVDRVGSFTPTRRTLAAAEMNPRESYPRESYNDVGEYLSGNFSMHSPPGGREVRQPYYQTMASPRTPLGIDSPREMTSRTSTIMLKSTHRDVVMAAVQRHWGDDEGLPDVINDVKTSLFLRTLDEAIAVVEEVLGKQLPNGLVQQCISRFSTPECPNGSQCRLLSDRYHLDSYSHPCPDFIRSGRCSLEDDFTHLKHYSHNQQRTRTVRQQQEPQDLSPSTGYTHSGQFSKISQPLDSWMKYRQSLERRDPDEMLGFYDSNNPTVMVEQPDGLCREYVDLGNIERFLIWLCNRLQNPSQITGTKPRQDTDGAIRVTWKCQLSGFHSVRERFYFTEEGKIKSHTMALDYSKPIRTKSSFRQHCSVDRPPPEPFSADIRLKGTPLTPSSDAPRDHVRHSNCTRSSCPRLSSPPERQTHSNFVNTSGYKERAAKTKKIKDEKSREREAAAAAAAAAATEEKEQASAALKIQSSFRGKAARRRAEEEKEKKEQEKAATRIQANFKGRVTRKQLQHKENDAAPVPVKKANVPQPTIFTKPSDKNTITKTTTTTTTTKTTKSIEQPPALTEAKKIIVEEEEYIPEPMTAEELAEREAAVLKIQSKFKFRKRNK